MSPCLLFIIDVSVTSIQCGLLNTAVKAIQTYLSCQENKEKPEKVAIMTYDRSVHFYQFSEHSDSPKMIVVSDTEDSFVPFNSSAFYQHMDAKSM